MSQKEFQRVKVIENAAGGRLSVREASCLLHLSQRQVQRLKRRYQPDSPAWVQHGNRGNSMPWAVTLPQKQLIVSLARGKYPGFNDSHSHGKTLRRRELSLSRESVRRILRAAKLASPQKRRPRQYRCRRPPRPRFGMMALTDASRHDWLQGRGPTLTLIGFQDDATGQILAAHFQLEAENTLGYLRALHALIVTHGIPLSLYRDRHSIFQRNDPHWTLAEQLAGKQSPTQLGRALEQLGITDPRLFAPGQGPHRARLAHLPGPTGQRTSSRPGRYLGASQHWARPVLRRLQPALRPSRRRRRLRLPPAAPPLRSGPLPRLALRTRGQPRSHRHFGPALDRAAAPARPSRLRRRNRRTRASTRRHAAHLSRRSLADRFAASPRMNMPQPRPAPLTSAQKRKTPMPRIYKLAGRPALAAVT